MKLTTAVNKIYTTPWDYVNDFTLTIAKTPDGIDNITKKHTNLDKPARGIDALKDNDAINLVIKTFTIPDTVMQPVESFVGGAWIYTTGIKELKRVDVTLFDHTDFLMHRTFSYILDGLKDAFPVDQYWTLEVKPYGSDKTIFKTDSAILDSVSNISLDRTNESQIAEFSISFKTK